MVQATESATIVAWISDLSGPTFAAFAGQFSDFQNQMVGSSSLAMTPTLCLAYSTGPAF
jgi:hypothetical protein|tara:strand:+ start:253 stop:429 length:177 start_codon:yes stop_codon:yes gene_type:complete